MHYGVDGVSQKVVFMIIGTISCVTTAFFIESLL